jgi:hypothetical protein
MKEVVYIEMEDFSYYDRFVSGKEMIEKKRIVSILKTRPTLQSLLKRVVFSAVGKRYRRLQCLE